jgi:hypothetical protein
MVRSLLIAAALGVDLLSAGVTTDTAAAAPFSNRESASAAHEVTPAHYQRGYDHRGYHPQHYMPPPRHHWNRYAPRRPDHSWRHQRSYQYGSRY